MKPISFSYIPPFHLPNPLSFLFNRYLISRDEKEFFSISVYQDFFILGSKIPHGRSFFFFYFSPFSRFPLTLKPPPFCHLMNFDVRLSVTTIFFSLLYIYHILLFRRFFALIFFSSATPFSVFSLLFHMSDFLNFPLIQDITAVNFIVKCVVSLMC